MKSSKGFTLIELLVVIAIVGILSSVVLASLSRSRSEARNSGIKSTLSSVRTQAERYQTEVGRYASVTGAYYAGNCLTSQSMFRETIITGEARTIADNITELIEEAYQQGGAAARECRLNPARTQYMIAIRLRDSTDYWCIDSAGTSRLISALPAAGISACQ